jgi:hypothetical protein
MTIHTKTDFSVNELEDSDYVYLREHGGFALNNKNKVLTVVFPSKNDEWTVYEVPVSDCRGFEIRSVTPDKIELLSTQGGLKGVGEGIGVSIRNKVARDRAKAANGIVLQLKSLETPEAFIHVAEEDSRIVASEALRQFIEEGAVNGQKIDIVLPQRSYNKSLPKNAVLPLALSLIFVAAFITLTYTTFSYYGELAARSGRSLLGQATYYGYSTFLMEVALLVALLSIAGISFWIFLRKYGNSNN